VCSAPEGSLGLMDPIAEFSELALQNGLYLHVDSAFGGFILPFMKELGYKVPDFDFKLPGVSSMMTDSHKLGMVPIAASFLMFRSSASTNKIPTEETLIHTLTSTKNGGLAAAAWALFQHLGKEGYKKYVGNLLDVTKFVSEGIAEIDGLKLVAKPYISVIGFMTEDGISLDKVHRGMLKRRWGVATEMTPEVKSREFLRLSLSPMRDKEHAQGFLDALKVSVRDAKK
jgi:tyrosine decarboxylase / aspartate 1-decarboxylase